MKDLLIVIWCAIRLIVVVVLAGAAATWLQQTLAANQVSLLTATLIYGALGFLGMLALIVPAFIRNPKDFDAHGC